MNLDSITPLCNAGSRRTKPVKKIIVHCSAEPPNCETGAAEIHRWHVGFGWSGIGYHYVVKTDGAVEGGRSIDNMGAHCRGHNDDSIGVCLIGGLDEDRKPSHEHYTSPQWASYFELIRALQVRYPNATLHGHREFANKACPCFDVNNPPVDVPPVNVPPGTPGSPEYQRAFDEGFDAGRTMSLEAMRKAIEGLTR